MSEIEITTSVKIGNLKIETSGKLFKVIGLDGVGLPLMSLNELIDLSKAIDAMSLEMAKISLKELGGHIGDKDWAK